MSKLKLLLDGKEYTEGRFGEGRFEEGITLATHLCLPLRATRRNEILGFSTTNTFKAWAKKQGIQADIAKGILKINRAKRQVGRMTKAQKEQLAQDQPVKVRKDTRRVRKLLADKGIRANEAAKIVRLAKRGEIGSIFMYDYNNYGGRWIHLGSGFYPHFGWFGWNDDVNSVINTSWFWSVLCRYTNYRGTWWWIPPFARIPDLGWFKNRASSAIVW